MKKFLILFSLFILPLIFYIFLSKGIYKYANLPVLTTQVTDIKNVIPTSSVTFKEHLSVVCFLGNDINTAKASLFNLNEIIYKRFYYKPLFQIVALIPIGKQTFYNEVIEEISTFTDIDKWRFIYAEPEVIETIFNSFNTPCILNENYYSKEAFIIDMKLRLRGRKDDKDRSDGKLFGYNMRSVAVLKNKMKDDIDVIYYQLKKSAEKKERIQKNR